MSRRYDFVMQRHGQSQRKKRKNKLPIKSLDLQTVSLFKEPKESEYEASWRKDLFSPEDTGGKEDERGEYPVAEEDLPLTVHAVGIGEQNPNYIGQEFSGITDRISKLLSDYEAMYDDKDQQGYAAMQEHLSGQMAMESLLTDYKSLCREREELLNSLQDSLDVDEEETLDEIENMNRTEHLSVDMEGAQRAIQETFQNVRDTTAKLKMMNKNMIALSKAGETNEELESEKRQLERELQMYKKMAVQQRKDIFNRRSSIRRDETQQWKLVAGEMVDMLKMVRHEGHLDKETLEKELNRILMTLNTQTEYIDTLKRDLSKQEKTVRNLEKDKVRLNNDKVMVEDELQTKQHELKQCKQYLRKVMTEKKDLKDKIKIDGAEIDLTEGAEELKTGAPGEEMTTSDILQAQVRDARKLVFKLEEENKELKRELESVGSGKEPAAEVPSAEQPTAAVDRKKEKVKECPNCPSYQAQIINIQDELKIKEKHIQRLQEDLNKLRAQLTKSRKEISHVKSELALAEAEVKEERLKSDARSAIQVTVETAATPPQGSESDEEEVKEKPKKASRLAVPTKKPKQRPVKSPKKRKQVVKRKKEDKQEEDEEEVEEEEEVVEEDDKVKAKAPKKKEEKRSLFIRKKRDLMAGECREEKAPYVKVREARMVTLADVGTQTTHYDRKATEGTFRESIGRQLQHRRRSMAETIMAGVPPGILEQETNATMLFIKEEADRLCDEISGLVEYGFDVVQQGAKTTRVLTETHLGESAMEMLETEDLNQQLDRAKAIKALMSGDYRRQSITASKKRRNSLHLERRGTIRRDSKLPLLDTGDGLFGRKREDSISESVTEHKDEDVTKHKDEEVTDRRDTAVKTEQGPPTARVNNLFPVQQTPVQQAPVQQTPVQQAPVQQAPVQQTPVQQTPVQQTPVQQTLLPERRMSEVPVEASEVFDATFVKESKWSTLKTFVNSLQPHKGGGCSHVVNEVKHIAEGSGGIPSEDQVKEQVKVMAQHAIDTLQSTAEILSHQLQHELTLYERFYKLWNEVREKQRASLHLQDPDRHHEDVPVVGKKLLAKVDGRDTDVIKTEESALFPPITPQVSAYQSGPRKAIATAGLSQGGMMIIQGAAPKNVEAIPSSTSQTKMKKRGKVKNYSRRQLLLKQKAVMDKMLHVDARIEDLHNVFSGMELDKKQQKTGTSGAGSQNINQQTTHHGIPPAKSDFYFPLTAHSVALPSLPQRLQIQGAIDHHPVKQETERKQRVPEEPTKEDENIKEPLQLPGMSNALWQRRSSIAKFPSQKALRKSFSEQQTTLPLLNINHILRVGQ